MPVNGSFGKPAGKPALEFLVGERGGGSGLEMLVGMGEFVFESHKLHDYIATHKSQHTEGVLPLADPDPPGPCQRRPAEAARGSSAEDQLPRPLRPFFLA